MGAEEAVAVETRRALASEGSLGVVALGVLVTRACPALIDVFGRDRDRDRDRGG